MTADSQPIPAQDGVTVGPRCGNNPNATLTAGDQSVVDGYRAYLARKASTRHTADSITDDALDALYAERDALLAGVARVRQMVDAWEERLPDVIRTGVAADALRAALEHLPVPAERSA